MGRVVGLAILLLVAVLVDGSSSCGKKAAQVALSHSERLFGSRKLFLRGGGGNQGVHPSWTWGSLPRRAYAWMVENWRRIRNVKGGRQGLGTVGTKRSAPMSGESSSSGRTASKRRKEGAEHPEEGGNFSEDPLLRGVKAIHHKGRGGHEKGAREASNFKPSSRFSDMSASDLLRETQGITSAGNCLYIVGKVPKRITPLFQCFSTVSPGAVLFSPIIRQYFGISGLCTRDEDHCQLLRKRVAAQASAH